MAKRRERPQDTGVPNQDVELIPALIDGGAQRVDFVVRLKVEGEQRGAAADGPDFVVDLLEGAGSPADQDEMGALLCVGQSHRPADAAGGSRDEGKTVSKAPGVVHGVSVDVAAAAPPRGSGVAWSSRAPSVRQARLLGSVGRWLHLKSGSWATSLRPIEQRLQRLGPALNRTILWRSNSSECTSVVNRRLVGDVGQFHCNRPYGPTQPNARRQLRYRGRRGGRKAAAAAVRKADR